MQIIFTLEFLSPCLSGTHLESIKTNLNVGVIHKKLQLNSQLYHIKALYYAMRPSFAFSEYAKECNFPKSPSSSFSNSMTVSYHSRQKSTCAFQDTSNHLLSICSGPLLIQLKQPPRVRVLTTTGQSCYLVAQSCPALWDPMDCSPPGSSVHGISQARILESVTIFFSRVIFLT